MGDDLDIYGDLYGDLPAKKPRPPPPAPTRQPPAEASSQASSLPSPVAGITAAAPDMSASPRPPSWRPRARNIVWRPPDADGTPEPTKPVSKVPPAPDVVEVLDDCTVGLGYVPSSEAAAEATMTPEKPRDFDTLQKELLAEEAGTAPPPGSPLSEAGAANAEDGGVISDGSDDTEDSGDNIQLGEVRASETGSAPQFTSPRRPPRDTVAAADAGRSTGMKTRRREVLLFMGPPPPLPASSSSSSSCMALLGGLPWWLPDTELRKNAEQFGPIRSIRVLDHPGSGKSTGVALLEYLQPEAVKKAASQTEGICKLAVWQSLAVRPRLVLISGELHGKLRSGVLPWPDGGPCSEDLRSILLRQFDLSHLEASNARGSRPERKGAPPPRRQGSQGALVPGRQDRSAEGSARRPRGSPDATRDQKEDESGGWADKLKRLKASVNSREDLGAVMNAGNQSPPSRR
eukprot:TRINITY_DN19869_c0_g1_i1.p1 TRINITY_DN19869_c0_g1~~TRINITY_DN19869_c0_g1_i1.p1  ORF type:complete len:471 (-),score=97.80 TRINITY_DN19869_c0_g1_i1:51-1430(-)